MRDYSLPYHGLILQTEEKKEVMLLPYALFGILIAHCHHSTEKSGLIHPLLKRNALDTPPKEKSL